MSFASESGYTPATIEAILDSLRTEINTQFLTAYTAESFIGSNHYKFFYAMAQRLQSNEVKTSEIFVYLQQYFAATNERILRPVATNPGLIDVFEASEWIASVKPMILADAGKISICVDADDGVHATRLVTITSYANLVSGSPDVITINGTTFTAQSTSVTPGGGTFQAATSNTATADSLVAQINAHAVISLIIKATNIGAVITLRAVHGGTAANAYTLTYTNNDANVGATVGGATLTGGTTRAEYLDDRLEICNIIKESTAAGNVTQGTEVESIVLSNGQSFDFKFNLPNRIDVLLRLTTTLSENNQVVILSPEDIKALLLANVAAKYRLGRNFEPQRYFTTADAPWCAQVLLEWSRDAGANWSSVVYDANYDDLFETPLENITLVEA